MAFPGLTDAVGLDAAPGQVGQAGPGGGALQEISLLAPEEQDASHLSQQETTTQLPRDSQAFIPSPRHHLTPHGSSSTPS